MKKVKILIMLLLIVFMLPIIINFYVIIKNVNNIYSINEVSKECDIALILGCSVLRDNTPSKMLQDRLNMGIDLYNKGKVKKILISGDHKESYSEIEVMYKYLIENGITDEVILIDDKGYSTSESLINYKNCYSSYSVIIVTQKYHLYRSLNIAHKLNINAIGVHAKLVNYNGSIFRELREILARNKDFVKFLCY